MSENKENGLRERLLSLPIPEGGLRMDFGGTKVFVLNPMTDDLWLMVRKMALELKSLDAAILVVNTLKAQGCPDPTKTLNFNERRAVEQAITDWTDPVAVDVKKNTSEPQLTTTAGQTAT